METAISSVKTDLLDSFKIHELKKLLEKVGLLIEVSGEITDKTPGTICAFYVSPINGSCQFVRKRFFYSQSKLNTWGDATKILKKNLLEKEEIFEESGVEKSMSLEFKEGEFILTIKNVR